MNGEGTQITPRRRDVYRAVESLTHDDPYGRPPTQRDVARKVQLSLVRTRQHLQALRLLGLVGWEDNEDRTLHVIAPLPPVAPVRIGGYGRKRAMQ